MKIASDSVDVKNYFQLFLTLAFIGYNRYAICMDERQGILCLGCNMRIFSREPYEAEWCPCGNVFVEGGDKYFRWGANDAYDAEIVTFNPEIDGEFYE